MDNRWTGGQYSLARAVLGLYLVVHLALAGDWVSLLLIVPALALAIGWHDRPAAFVILFVLRPEHDIGLLFLLLLHLATPPAPYGSVAARGRIDPDNGWSLPPFLHLMLWAALGMALVQGDASRWHGPVIGTCIAAAAYVALTRPFVWLAAVPLLIWTEFHPGTLLLYLFTFDPAWIPGRLPESREVVFYDGTCGLCHRFVRFLLAEDREPDTLAFAALQSEAAPKLEELPDSIVVQKADGELLVKSAAVAHILLRVGGYWRLLGHLVLLVPRGVRDFGYDFVAKVRHRIFKRPDEACPILPPHLRERFLG